MVRFLPYPHQLGPKRCWTSSLWLWWGKPPPHELFSGQSLALGPGSGSLFRKIYGTCPSRASGVSWGQAGLVTNTIHFLAISFSVEYIIRKQGQSLENERDLELKIEGSLELRVFIKNFTITWAYFVWSIENCTAPWYEGWTWKGACRLEQRTKKSNKGSYPSWQNIWV